MCSWDARSLRSQVLREGMRTLHSLLSTVRWLVARFGRSAVDDIMRDASLSHAARVAALAEARAALEATLRAKGMFRLEVRSLHTCCFRCPACPPCRPRALM